MKYHFLHHTLDTKTSELSSTNGSLLLKKKPFLLLQCLIKNPNQILSKDFLLKEVWDDRFVSDNTIAQTVGQLRQLIEADSKNPEIIITHRGRGISFTPTVKIAQDDTTADALINSTNEQQKPVKGQWNWLVTLLVIMGFSALFWYQSSHKTEPEPLKASKSTPNLLIISGHNDASEMWLQNSVSEVFSGLMYQQYNGKVTGEQLDNDTDVNDYINNQWNINPNLNVVTTDLVKDEFGYSLTLDFTRENQINQTQKFSAKSVNDVLLAASQWLGEEMNAPFPELTEYLPDDETVAELYLRGVAAENDSDYDKSSQYFELALTELPNFHLARLKLAGVKKHQGEFDEAFVLLDTLENTALYSKVELKAVAIRGYIYDVQGRFDEAKILFEETLNKYAQSPAHQLNPLRFELSYVLTNLNQVDLALDYLNQVEITTKQASDPLLFADTLQKKASIYQSIGQTADALSYADQALNIYLKLGELLGAAKTNNLLARIYTLKSDYKQAKYHLFETLSITRKMEYKLGVGAAINELVFILIREGGFDEAEKLTAEMEQIAIEIDYTHMLIAAKQHAATLAIYRGEWQVAEQFLQQQEQLARTSNNQAALITGHFSQLEYWVARKNSAGAQPILTWLEEHIDKEQNLRRHIALELQRAQLMAIDGNERQAIDLLVGIKGLTESADDKQSLVEINNTLTEIYLPEKTDKALRAIEENNKLNPVAYPYLLLYSKALKANDQLVQSMEKAIECKNKSGQRWTREDEAYLSQLRLLVN